MSVTTSILRTIESRPGPISTPDLIAIHGPWHRFPRQRVWARLRELEAWGLIRKVRRSTKGTWWRTT